MTPGNVGRVTVSYSRTPEKRMIDKIIMVLKTAIAVLNLIRMFCGK
ncbi:hypothetical protein DR73_4424 [Enterobacteriaceae bacterium ATCC 29904]|nr:hypothetical protein DR73_4424 [Enterobacteriaceae bacterium ATCC 29904]